MTITIPTPKTRRGRALTIATVFVLVFATAAAAIFIARARVDGSLRSGSFVPEWTTASLSGQGTTTSGGSAQVTSGVLSIDTGTMFPGDTFTVGGDVRVKPAGNAASGKVVGFSLAGLPTGWKAELLTGCGATVNTLTGASVSFRITMLDTAIADGATVTIQPQSGVEMQPAAQAPATPTCPAQTP
jgi:hypothetical protein